MTGRGTGGWRGRGHRGCKRGPASRRPVDLQHSGCPSPGMSLQGARGRRGRSQQAPCRSSWQKSNLNIGEAREGTAALPASQSGDAMRGWRQMPPRTLEPGKRESPMIPPSGVHLGWGRTMAATACGPSPIAVLRACPELRRPLPLMLIWGKRKAPMDPRFVPNAASGKGGKGIPLLRRQLEGRFDLPRMSFNWVCIGSGALTSGQNLASP